jgi:hypothetical protein
MTNTEKLRLGTYYFNFEKIGTCSSATSTERELARANGLDIVSGGYLSISGDLLIGWKYIGTSAFNADTSNPSETLIFIASWHEDKDTFSHWRGTYSNSSERGYLKIEPDDHLNARNALIKCYTIDTDTITGTPKYTFRILDSENKLRLRHYSPNLVKLKFDNGKIMSFNFNDHIVEHKQIYINQSNKLKDEVASTTDCDRNITCLDNAELKTAYSTWSRKDEFKPYDIEFRDKSMPFKYDKTTSKCKLNCSANYYWSEYEVNGVKRQRCSSSKCKDANYVLKNPFLTSE